MKKLIAVMFLVALSACTWGKIEPGHVGVVVPLSGNDKGTLETTQNGWYIYSFNTQVYEFPTFNQQHNWTAHKDEGKEGVNERLFFGDKNGLRLGADVGIQFHVPGAQVTTLFKTYRQDLDHIRDTVLKNSVRNALNMTAQSYTAEEIFGDKRGEFFTKVFDAVKKEMAPNGLEVSNLYLNGELQLPEQIQGTIQAKLQATMLAQQKENEKRAVEAEAAKIVAKAEGDAKAAKAQAEGEASAEIARANGEATSRIARAKAEAEANRVIGQSLTSSILDYRIRMRQLDIQETLAGKWGGGVPTTILPGQTNSPFLYDLRAPSSAQAK